MINALFEEIPTPEAMEYDGDIPSAFARLPAFSPALEELERFAEQVVPLVNGRG